jgi:hypothetical protein
MKIVDAMNPISELKALQAVHGLTLEDLSRETYDYLGMTHGGIAAMLKRGHARPPVVIAIAKWLADVGRAKYPV